MSTTKTNENPQPPSADAIGSAKQNRIERIFEIMGDFFVMASLKHEEAERKKAAQTNPNAAGEPQPRKPRT